MSKRPQQIAHNLEKCHIDIYELANDGINHGDKTRKYYAEMYESVKAMKSDLEILLGTASEKPIERTSASPNDVSISASAKSSDTKQKTEADVKKKYEYDYKEIFLNMTNIMRQLFYVKHESKSVERLSKLLCHWYGARFVNQYDKFKRFKYSPQRVNTLIKSIVLAYGYYCEINQSNVFFKEFKEWLDKLGKDKGITENYAVPLSVSHFEMLISDKSTPEKVARANNFVGYEGFTVAAIVLWNELYSSVLYKLNSYNPMIFANVDAIFEEVWEHNPKAAEEFQDVYGTANFDYADYNIS